MFLLSKLQQLHTVHPMRSQVKLNSSEENMSKMKFENDKKKIYNGKHFARKSLSSVNLNSWLGISIQFKDA